MWPPAPPPALALRVGPVLDFATEIHAAAQKGAKPVNITVERYHYDPTRFRVTFELGRRVGPQRPRRFFSRAAPTVARESAPTVHESKPVTAATVSRKSSP